MPSERPQTAEFQVDGPVDGMDNPCADGSYIRIYIEAKDGTQYRFLTSRGGAEVLAAGIRGALPAAAQAPATPPAGTVPVRVAELHPGITAIACASDGSRILALADGSLWEQSRRGGNWTLVSRPVPEVAAKVEGTDA